MTTVFILPGLGNSGPEHWQSHWERQDPLCLRVKQDEWDTPQCVDWVARLDEAISMREAPVVLAGHSSACAMVAHWCAGASCALLSRVRGALLVAPSDPDNANFPDGPVGFGPVPMQALPFATIVVASTNDRYVSAPRAEAYARAWHSRFVLLPDAGHINVASGFGPWPEGFALLKSL